MGRREGRGRPGSSSSAKDRRQAPGWRNQVIGGTRPGDPRNFIPTSDGRSAGRRSGGSLPPPLRRTTCPALPLWPSTRSSVATSTRLRPRSLAKCKAWSACASGAGASKATSCAVITMPMLTVAPTGRPSTSLAASAKAVRIRSASATAFSRLTLSEHRRELLAAEPADEVGRSHVRLRRVANTCSTRSPIACPNRSLIDLK